MEGGERLQEKHIHIAGIKDFLLKQKRRHWCLVCLDLPRLKARDSRVLYPSVIGREVEQEIREGIRDAVLVREHVP